MKIQFKIFFCSRSLYCLINIFLAGFIAWAYPKWWSKLLSQYSYNRQYYKGKLKEVLQIKEEILAELPVLLPELQT